MVVIEDITLQTGIVMSVVIFIIIVSKPERFYRTFKIEYIVPYLLDENSDLKRHVIRKGSVKKGLFSLKDGKHLVDPKARFRSNGKAAYLYKWGNIAPLGLPEAMDIIEFTASDLETVIDDKVIRDFGELGRDKIKNLAVAIGVISLLMIGVSLYILYLQSQALEETMKKIGLVKSELSNQIGNLTNGGINNPGQEFIRRFPNGTIIP